MALNSDNISFCFISNKFKDIFEQLQDDYKDDKNDNDDKDDNDDNDDNDDYHDDNNNMYFRENIK